MTIVYKSSTGFTKEYALLLSKATGLKCLPLNEAERELTDGAEVFHMGSVMGGHISGLDRAAKRWQVKGACGVGMSPQEESTLELIRKANSLPGGPIFYVQGGWAPDRVGWVKRSMVNLVTKSTRQALAAKSQNATPEEKALLDMFVHGGNFVSAENLKFIEDWMAGQSR